MPFPVLKHSFYCHKLFSVLLFHFCFFFQVMNLIGDVKGKVAVMLDDMIDTAGD